MSNGQTIRVHDQQDIITARMLVRELARARGLSVRDQACISLATSSLAQILFAKIREGKIIMEGIKDGGGRMGVRVVCSRVYDGADDRVTPGMFGETRQMVDELTMERSLSPREIRVSVTRWGPAPDPAQAGAAVSREKTYG
jgi:hypothetical protein